MNRTLGALHHANLSQLRALGFKTVTRQHADGRRGHAAIRHDGTRSTVVLLPTAHQRGLISALSREPGGRATCHTMLWDVDPLCLTDAVQDVLNGGDTRRMHGPDCTCPNN